MQKTKNAIDFLQSQKYHLSLSVKQYDTELPEAQFLSPNIFGLCHLQIEEHLLLSSVDFPKRITKIQLKIQQNSFLLNNFFVYMIMRSFE